MGSVSWFFQENGTGRLILAQDLNKMAHDGRSVVRNQVTMFLSGEITSLHSQILHHVTWQ